MNVLDVMTVQKRNDAFHSEKINQLDYGNPEKPGLAIVFLFECAAKLQVKITTSCCAAALFHRFFRNVDKSLYDEYLIAISGLYLAGKIKDEPIKIRDALNVAYNCLNRNSPPVDLVSEYWQMRDAIIQAELLISRMLKFELNTELPHKYLLYYAKTLKDWIGSDIWCSLPITKIAMSFLHDFHQSSKVLDHKPTHIAVCCLSLALQIYGVRVPLSGESDENSMWYTPLVCDLTKEKHWEILEDITEIYSREALLSAKTTK